MATPTAAELFTLIKNLVHYREEIYELASQDATNLVGLQDTIEQAVEGDYSDDVLSALVSVRNAINLAVQPGAVGAALVPLLRAFMRAIGSSPNISSVPVMLDRLYEYMSGKLGRSSGAITGATQANPVVITSAAHGLANDDMVRIEGVVGMTELNNNTYKVANQASNTFELSGVNGSAYTAYSSGGTWYQVDLFNDRNYTFATMSMDSGNTGNGSLHRLTVDDHNYTYQTATAEAKRATCVRDARTGTKEHAEEWEIRGAYRGRDNLERVGSGITTAITSANSQSTSRYLTNPSFESTSGTVPTASTPTTLSSTTECTGWTVGTAANTQLDVDTVYRGGPNISTSISMKFTDNNTAEQILQDNVNPRIDTGRPMYLQVAVYRESSCDGNLILTLGSHTETTDITTLNNAAWNIVKLTLDENLWPRVWNKNDASIKFEMSGRSTGAIYLDDVICEPFTQHDGTFWFLVGGATPWVRDDFATGTDTESGAVMTRNLAEIFGRSFPTDNAGDETQTDP